MLFLRSSLFFLGQAVTAPIFTLIAFLALPLNPVTRNVLISGWARSMIWWLRITCGIRHEVTGLEHLPDTPSIILSKHQSAWETLAFQSIFPTQSYVMKRELLWIPIFGWGLAMSSPIAIDRSAGREALKKLVSKGQRRLKQGLWVVIFPEGTRKAPGEKASIKSVAHGWQHTRKRRWCRWRTMPAKAGLKIPLLKNQASFKFISANRFKPAVLRQMYSMLRLKPGSSLKCPCWKNSIKACSTPCYSAPAKRFHINWNAACAAQ